MTIASDRAGKQKRKIEALKEFRRAVLARAKVPDGWQCERCKRLVRYKHQIHAHHRLSRGQHGSNLITNGAALCWYCHHNVHAKRGDWEKWLVVRNKFRIHKEAG